MSGRKQLPNQVKSPVRSRQAINQSVDLTALEAADLALDARLTTAEGDIVALEAVDVAYDTRLDALEAFDLTLQDLAFLDTVNNSQWLGTDLSVANGGTGASDAPTARTNLGLAIGTNVQAYDAGLQSISGLTTLADRMIYTTASDVYAVTPLTSFARTLLDDADAATMRTTLGVAATSHTHIISDVTGLQAALDLKAPLASPALTGTPTAPTATAGTNTTQVATTAFVQTAVTNLIDSSPAALDTLNELAAALGDDPNFATTVSTSLGLKLNASAVSAYGLTLIDDADAATARTTLGLGTAATQNTGTSGATIPLLNGTNAWSGAQTWNFAANRFAQNDTNVIANATGGLSSLDVFQNSTGAAFMSFHRNGAYAAYFGLDTDNQLKIGGWSFGAVSHKVWHAGNDGTGSGLDADLLDGVEGSSYVTLTGTQTLTNKTLTSPTINAGTLSGIFAGDHTVSGVTTRTSANPYRFNTAAGTQRLTLYQTSGSNRWAVGVDSNAETGSNAGSNFVFYNYTDAGAFIGTSLNLNRSTGNATFGGSVTITGTIATSLGSVSAPSYSFTGDTNTGMYSASADTLDFATAGARRLSISSSGGVTVAPNVTTASAFIELGGGRTGDGYAYIDFVGDTTYTDYAFRILRNNTGANASTQIIHRGTGNFDLSTSEAAALRLITGGASRVVVASTGEVSFNGQIQAATGTAATPTISFASDTNTGFFSPSADQIGLTLGGTERWRWNTSFLYAGNGNGSAALSNNIGTVTVPNFTFVGDTNTGMYWIGADQIGFSAGGTLRATIDTTGIQAAVAVSSQTTGTLTNECANKQVNLTGNVTLNTAVFAANDKTTFDPGTAARTFTRGAGLTMFVNGTDSATATLAANQMGGMHWRSSTVVILTGAFT